MSKIRVTVFLLTVLALSVRCESASSDEKPQAQKTPPPAPAAAKESPPAAQAPSPAPSTEASTPAVPPDIASPPSDATKTPSGLAFKVLAKGQGTKHPHPTDLVTVHYTGWTSADGKMQDSSVARGKPLTAALNRTIKGWQEGVADMVVGEKRRFWIPQALAFEGNPTAPNAGRGMWVYDVELLDIRPGPSNAPSDVAAAPADATRTASGLAWKLLQPGNGKTHPGPKSRVRIHFNGWSPDGKLVGSSIATGNPVEVQLGSVNKGWTEGIQLMVEGETRRFWVPARLAYLGQEGRPQTDLVYDVELIAILD